MEMNLNCFVDQMTNIASINGFISIQKFSNLGGALTKTKTAKPKLKCLLEFFKEIFTMTYYPLDKYKFVFKTGKNGNHQVMAISTYGGRTVRGVASCAVGDEFSLDRGKELAAARCNLKVAQKRLKRAKSRKEDAMLDLRQAHIQADKMTSYVADSMANVYQAEDELNRILKEL
jgi:hypothetical protein